MKNLQKAAVRGSVIDLRLLEVKSKSDSDGAGGPVLTRREREVYQHLQRGKQNKEIASALNITDRTVAFHVSNILHKLGATSRTQILAKDWSA